MSFARRARGVLVMALLWAFTWMLVGLAILIYDEGPSRLIHYPRHWLLLLIPAVWGAIGGAAFAGFVAVLGGRRGWNALGVGHAVAWGALSGLAAPIALTALRVILVGWLSWSEAQVPLGLALLSVIVNGALAAGTIALAKRGAPSEVRPVG
jgi:hypothetical protein